MYPFIELLTAILLSLLYIYIPLRYFPAYFIFFSALIVTIRSDFETMLISRYTTLFLAPLGFLLSIYKLLPISRHASIIGALIGYLFLFTINAFFKWVRSIDGIGEGDFDLLLFIGSFTGVIGCWTSVTIGSIVGSCYGLVFILLQKYHLTKEKSRSNVKIPFGPFLALGAILFVFLQNFYCVSIN